MNTSFKNKTALITGASRGLGLQIAKQFWLSGASLILISRSIDQLNEIRKNFLKNTSEIEQEIQVFASDFSDPIAVTNLISILKNLTIDILVNNAAIQGPIGPLWENDWTKWQSALQVNLLTPIALCRSLVPQMIQRRSGKIINLSGGGATVPRENFTSYAVAKVAIVRFSETLAEEVKKYNITVNCIAPGLMNTSMIEEIFQAGIEKVGNKEFNIINQKRLQQDNDTIESAAKLCSFLASSKSADITGKLISAVWDPWQRLSEYAADLQNSDIFTLRRIVPNDRGKDWSNNA